MKPNLFFTKTAIRIDLLHRAEFLFLLALWISTGLLECPKTVDTVADCDQLQWLQNLP